MLNIPRQICPFPAVEYIPLTPESFLECDNPKKQLGIKVFATLNQFCHETGYHCPEAQSGTQAYVKAEEAEVGGHQRQSQYQSQYQSQCQSQSQWQWPTDRIVLACYGFRPLAVYYRGHEAVIIAQSVPELFMAVALDSGFFYKELINFEVFLETGAQIAKTSWQVPEYVAIRRPPHSKGARSAVPGMMSRG
ncbi:MAG: hypothetical protein ACOX8I_03975 [Bacillota bacterium]|jgi:hypothetical protein